MRFRFASMAVVLLGIAGWVYSMAPFDDLLDRSGTPWGGDYVMLYVAGQTVAEGEAASLYDDALNQQRTAALFPGMDPSLSWPFRYPPTVAACMSPLSRLPIGWSFAMFGLTQVGLLALSIRLFCKGSRLLQEHRVWCWPLCCAPLVVETMIGGQSSFLALACIAMFFHFSSRDRTFLAGAVLAVAMYKPNVLLLFIVGSLILRPKLLLGFVPTVLVGVAVAIGTTGWDVLMEYITLGSRLAASEWSLETPFWKVHGLAPIVQSICLGNGKLVTLLLGVALVLTVACTARLHGWHRSGTMSVLLLLNALFNPYVPIYDLVLLLAAAALWSVAAAEEPRWRLSPVAGQSVLALLFLGPHLSQAVARPLGFQLFPLVLLGVLCWLVLRFFSQRSLAASMATGC